MCIGAILIKTIKSWLHDLKVATIYVYVFPYYNGVAHVYIALRDLEDASEAIHNW